MIIYCFGYSSCIFEDSGATLSVHRTKRGAEMAMSFHKENARKEWEKIMFGERDRFPFGEHESWFIMELELNE